VPEVTTVSPEKVDAILMMTVWLLPEVTTVSLCEVMIGDEFSCQKW